MNKKLLIFIGITVLTMAAALGYTLSMTTSEEPAQQITTATPTATKPESSESSTATPTTKNTTPQKGTYVAYNAGTLAASKGRKLLFFHAPWCPQCRDLNDSITAQGVPDDMTIFKVDYDSSTALRQKYGVTIQTTIVEVDNTGHEVKKHVAYDHPNLTAVLKALE